jgi:outer membrane protein TolC
MKLIKVLLLIFCFLPYKAFALELLTKKTELLENTFNSRNNYLDSTINIRRNCQLPRFESKEIDIYQVIDFAVCRNIWHRSFPSTSETNSSSYEIGKLSPLLPEEKDTAIIQQGNFVRNNELPNNNRDLTIGLLFDFYKKNLRKNIDYILLLKANRDYYLQRFIYDVIRLYCDFSFLNQDLEIKIDAEKFYQTIYQVTKKKYDHGLSSLKDLTKAKNSYSSSIIDRKNTEKILAISEQNLLKILEAEKLPWPKNKKIQSPFITMDKNWLDSAGRWILDEKRSQNRPELKILTAKKKLSYLEIKTIKVSHLPNVFLYASSKYDKSRNLINQQINEIGLKISLFLPNKEIDNYNIQKSYHEIKLANEKRRLLISKFNLQIQQQYQDFKTIQNDIDENNKLLEQILKNRDNSLIKYKNNHTTTSKILSLEQKYYQTQRQNNILQYQQFTAWAFVFLGL